MRLANMILGQLRIGERQMTSAALIMMIMMMMLMMMIMMLIMMMKAIMKHLILTIKGQGEDPTC